MLTAEEVNTQLIARVHHNVNNAITALIGQAQLLLREELSQTVRQRVEIMEQTAKRIAGTVDELRQPTPRREVDADTDSTGQTVMQPTKQRILSVEDNEQIRVVISALLEQAGYEVKLSSTVVDGLRQGHSRRRNQVRRSDERSAER